MEFKGYVAIVGSRDVPLDELELLIRLGRTVTDVGFGVRSGDAFGSDRAGWYGARQSELYDTNNTGIYVLQSYKNRKRAQEHGFLVAEDYPEKWLMATSLALEARGSWGGIEGPHNQFKRDLHIRNVYQVLGHTLDQPVQAIFYYAKPVGKVENEKVSGGTNTAVQVARIAEVPRRINLATEAGVQYVHEFLKKYERDQEYDDIDWREILKPDDPRLEHL